MRQAWQASAQDRLYPEPCTLYCYDGDQVIAEYDGSGTLIKEYIYGPGIDEPVCMIVGGAKYYYHYDGLGSVVAMLEDYPCQLAEQYSYDAFGRAVIRDAAGDVLSGSLLGNRFMFTGREYDAESGLYYYRARYYNPKIGRFASPDPIGMAEGPNFYLYVFNNPIMRVDPCGFSNSWNWGWWDILTFYPHAFYDLGAYLGHGKKEFDGSYTGIGNGKKTVETCVTTQIPAGEVIGAAEVGVEAGKMALEVSKRNKQMNELAEDLPDWKELPVLPKDEEAPPKKK